MYLSPDILGSSTAYLTNKLSQLWPTLHLSHQPMRIQGFPRTLTCNRNGRYEHDCTLLLCSSTSPSLSPLMCSISNYQPRPHRRCQMTHHDQATSPWLSQSLLRFPLLSLCSRTAQSSSLRLLCPQAVLRTSHTILGSHSTCDSLTLG